jgi:hypothetical protein
MERKSSHNSYGTNNGKKSGLNIEYKGISSVMQHPLVRNLSAMNDEGANKSRLTEL